MNWEQLLLIRRDRVGDGFKTLVDHKIRKRRRDERLLAEYRMTKASAPSEKLMRC
jgi:hypothetical protein